MGISEKKMQIVINNYFKQECDINTSIRGAFEKGFRIGVKKGQSAQPEPHWIPCSERLPSETVIATVETKVFGHRYVCEAVWIPRWTWKASFDFKWEDCLEYKEDDDEYYVLEGWYERVHNWDEYAYVAIDDNVIAWMPIPIHYCGGDGK